MDENIFDQVHDIDLKKTMEDSYISYAMSVIASRALPDVRDGLKPVQRRILHSMVELNNGPDKPHRKCARIVGDTMGKYHPHGDSSIYEALVKMAQDFNTRYPLVDGHGNFGSVDGDGAAAMRYTEARLSKISMELLADIGKDTVDFVPNFDETEKEPVVLPARFPNLLVNGTTGIAVGMATNIPPHNLREVIAAIVKMIDNRIEEDRETDIEEILQIIKGPDFPSGGIILGKSGIEEAYRTGRGKIKVKSVTNIEPMANGKNRIVVTEIPYMVNKARLIEKIAELVKLKKVDGITDLRDESDRSGMRICIELRRDVNPTIVLNQLFKHTQLQDSYGIIMLALVDQEPKILNIKDMLHYYMKHQEEVVTRRTRYDLNKAEERAHILEGLLIAIDNIDEVISIIRSSSTTAEAKTRLMERFGLTDAQAQAIVDMRLRALTGLERQKLEDEYKELEVRIAELREILGDEKKLLMVIRKEIQEISDKYGDDRRTMIGFDEEEITTEDMIEEGNTIIARTHMGYIKRMSEDNFKSQNRGGKGIKGMQTIDEDYIEDLMMTSTHEDLLFFTSKGKVYHLKAYQIPEASRTARGTALINLIPLMPEETVSSIIPVSRENDGKYLLMATRKGTVKKTLTTEYYNIRKNGLQAVTLREDDALIEVKAVEETEDIFLVTRFGQCIRFRAQDVRATGRASMGVTGMRLEDGDEVVSMLLYSQGDKMLLVSENGLGKKTNLDEFTTQFRGGKGIKCYKINEKSGNLVGAKAVTESQEILIITTEGVIIRTSVAGISTLGRITSGVRLMNINLDRGVRIASFALVREEPEEEKGPEAETEETRETAEDFSEAEDLSDETEEENVSEEDVSEETSELDLDENDRIARDILLGLQNEDPEA
ncbi:MAG: DNA gyrase subunit A [Lachnospiraceae bacterium]|nr:DNA gyrase subunit A [Lachnospiraceae bacterium]